MFLMHTLGPLVIIARLDPDFFGFGVECFWSRGAFSLLVGPLVINVGRRGEAPCPPS